MTEREQTGGVSEGTGPEESWLALAASRLGGRRMNMIMFLLPGFAFGLLLLLRAWGTIAHEPLWVYGSVFALTQVEVMVVRPFTVRRPPGLKLCLEIIAEVTVVMLFAYETGWGPELIVAFVALGTMSIVRHGSAAWKAVFLVNVVAIALGQIAVVIGLAPSKLSGTQSETLAGLGLIIFGLMIGLMTVLTRQVERTNDEIMRTSAEIKRTSAEIEAASRELARSEERFRSLLQYSSDSTMVISPDGRRVLYASPATFELLGAEPDELFGRGIGVFIHPEDRERVSEEVAALFETDQVARIEFRIVAADRTVREVEGVVSDLRDNDAVGGIAINVRDITERKQLEENLSYLVHHDVLTGLPNRRLLLDRLQGAIARNRRVGPGPPDPAVLFVDLDRFKIVNDQMGHACGDELLVQVGDRMRQCVRETDTLARFGGDEFVVLGENFADAAAARCFAERLLRCVEEPFDVGGQKVTIGMSVGIAFAHGTVAAEEVLDRADQAMYMAKNEPVNHVATAVYAVS